jgi:hypothetical protein
MFSADSQHSVDEPLESIQEESTEMDLESSKRGGSLPGEDFGSERAMPHEASDLRLEEDYSKYVEVGDTDADVPSVRPPVFYTDTTVDFDKPLPLRAPMPVKDKIAAVKKKLAECKNEKEWHAEVISYREEQIRILQSQSIPKEDADQVIELMTEWVAPPRPTPLSSRTLQKLVRIAQKQSLRVNKILSLPSGGFEENAAQHHQYLMVGEGRPNSSALLQDLMQDLRARIESEQKKISELMTQRQVLEEPTTLADVEVGRTRKNKLRTLMEKQRSGGAVSRDVSRQMSRADQSRQLTAIVEENSFYSSDPEEVAKNIPMSSHNPRSIAIRPQREDLALALTDADDTFEPTVTRSMSRMTDMTVNRGLTKDGLLK